MTLSRNGAKPADQNTSGLLLERDYSENRLTFKYFRGPGLVQATYTPPHTSRTTQTCRTQSSMAEYDPQRWTDADWDDLQNMSDTEILEHCMSGGITTLLSEYKKQRTLSPTLPSLHSQLSNDDFLTGNTFLPSSADVAAYAAADVTADADPITAAHSTTAAPEDKSSVPVSTCSGK